MTVSPCWGIHGVVSSPLSHHQNSAAEQCWIDGEAVEGSPMVSKSVRMVQQDHLEQHMVFADMGIHCLEALG